MHFRQCESRRDSQTTGPLAFLFAETNLKFLHLPSSGIIWLPPRDHGLPWAEASYPKDVAHGGRGVLCHRQWLLLQARSQDSPSLALSKDEVKGGDLLFLEHLQHLRTNESCKEQAALAIALPCSWEPAPLRPAEQRVTVAGRQADRVVYAGSLGGQTRTCTTKLLSLPSVQSHMP